MLINVSDNGGKSHTMNLSLNASSPSVNLVSTALPKVNPAILDPRDTYADASIWEEKAKDLASRFIKNFAKYTTNEAGKALVAAGPQL